MSRPRARLDTWISAALFAAAFLALWATEQAVGFVRDESVYFAAAESYAGWFRVLFQAPSVALQDATIVRFFDVNHEHPVFMKVLFGLSHLWFAGPLRDAAAFRLPAFAVAATIPVLTYRLGAGIFGRAAGLFAAVSFLLVPRQFFNAHLACFDIPVAAFWLWVVYAFWRAQERDHGWIWCGIAFGIALGTKHNALFLPFVLAPFTLWRARQATVADPESRAWANRCLELVLAVAALYLVVFLVEGDVGFRDHFLLLSPQTVLFLAAVVGVGYCLWRLRALNRVAFRAIAPLWGMATIGLAVFYLHWPYLWHHPVERVAWWLAFHAQHNHYTWFYLGELLREPPFPLAYVVVVTALTVPVTLFLPMAIGFGVTCIRVALTAVRRWRPTALGNATWAEALVLLNAIVPIALISHPNVPHFGGVKHWFPAMPFLALLAGVCVVRAAGTLRTALGPRLPRATPPVLVAALAVLLFAPATIALARIHPYGTSFYGELAGGVPGAASLGMQRQFWSNNVTGVLPWLNANAPQGARVYLHEVNGYSFRDYQRNGMLRADLRPAGGPNDADLAAYQYHQEFREQEMNIWQAFGTTQPVYGLYVDETPQVVVYRRR